MPMREYIILDPSGSDTGIVIEHICKNPPPAIITGEDGTLARLKAVSLIARTSVSWSEAAGTRYGINGYYNRALGCRVSSDKEADKIALSRGLVRMDDFDKHLFDDKFDSIGEDERKKNIEIDKMASEAKKYESMSFS